MKLRRSALYVPADNARALEKARGLDVDVLILDLEDAVAPQAKVQARVHAMAAVGDFGGRETVIRINGAGTPWHDDDMAAALMARPDAVLLPKVNNVGDLPAIDIPLWAMIETPAAVINLHEISHGVQCLVLGGNDLLKEMGARHRPDRANLQYVMSQMVLIARAHHIAVLDGVHNRIDDADGFAQACEMARDFGFDGKTLIHPGQIAACHAAFVPSPDEVAAAKRVLAAFADNPGKGAIRLDGQMVEALDAEIAVALLARAGDA
ncbi:MAG: CoA ester lyase [Alphaproteobacteria bacterium]|nr:CoA ester lyase [Alphaproteobacteria bacterium]